MVLMWSFRFFGGRMFRRVGFLGLVFFFGFCRGLVFVNWFVFYGVVVVGVIMCSFVFRFVAGLV